jgi:hypothetical protein
MKIKEKITLAQKIVSEAKKELNKDREEKYKERAKTLLEDIQEAQRTVNLLERQLKNFMKEVDLNN